MKQKLWIGIGVVLIFLIGIGVFIWFNKENNALENNREPEIIEDEPNDNQPTINERSVVIYFSATGNTERIANLINEVTNNDIIEIVPKVAYTSEDLNYNNDDSRANKEQQDSESRPEIAEEIDITNYDVIYLGYPIWWEDVPHIILTFLDNQYMSEKTIIPFCTSGGSGISTSVETLKEYSNGRVLEGRRFSGNATKDEVENWLKSLNL